MSEFDEDSFDASDVSDDVSMDSSESVNTDDFSDEGETLSDETELPDEGDDSSSDEDEIPSDEADLPDEEDDSFSDVGETSSDETELPDEGDDSSSDEDEIPSDEADLPDEEDDSFSDEGETSSDETELPDEGDDSSSDGDEILSNEADLPDEEDDITTLYQNYGHGGTDNPTSDWAATYPESHFVETSEQYLDEYAENTQMTNQRALRELEEFQRLQEEEKEEAQRNADAQAEEQWNEEQSELEYIADEARAVANESDIKMSKAETEEEREALKSENSEAHRNLDNADYDVNHHFRGF